MYLGAICDLGTHIYEWVELWVQDLNPILSQSQGQITNSSFDQRWKADGQRIASHLRSRLILTPNETDNPSPVLILKTENGSVPGMARTQSVEWRLCKDDALLEEFGLEPYSTSVRRYLYQPFGGEPRTFISTAADVAENSYVQDIDRLRTSEAVAVFNPGGGLLRVRPFSPLSLDDYLRVLEGQPWPSAARNEIEAMPRTVYTDLRRWSSQRKGGGFLLHEGGNPSDALSEIFFLKLAMLHEMFQEVRGYVKAHQVPMLNLTPASFGVELSNVGNHFPALWTARCSLVKPGLAYALKIKSTEQRYFLRLGASEPSPFLPPLMGAHSLGIGSVRLRSVTEESSGTVLDGTLLADDYLGLNAQDLLWFRLPLGEERLEFYAHVYKQESLGPKEVRFRTVPSQLTASIIARLKQSAGTVYPRSPYEVWPLLSSPCDLYSLAIMAVRILLANSSSELPVIVDEFLSLSYSLGSIIKQDDDGFEQFQAYVANDERLTSFLSAARLVDGESRHGDLKNPVHLQLWFETMYFILRLVPGAGEHSFCSNFGNVSPFALETIFDAPAQELESLLRRLRSCLLPSVVANEEIAFAVAQELLRLKQG